MGPHEESLAVGIREDAHQQRMREEHAGEEAEEQRLQPQRALHGAEAETVQHGDRAGAANHYSTQQPAQPHAPARQEQARRLG